MPASGLARFLALQRLAGNRAVANSSALPGRFRNGIWQTDFRPAQRDGPSTRSEPLRPGDPPPSGGGSGYGINSRGARQIANGTFRWSLASALRSDDLVELSVSYSRYRSTSASHSGMSLYTFRYKLRISFLVMCSNSSLGIFLASAVEIGEC